MAPLCITQFSAQTVICGVLNTQFCPCKPIQPSLMCHASLLGPIRGYEEIQVLQVWTRDLPKF
jgi:hypothetical protein